MKRYDITIKDTHRALYYEDGILVELLGAGRHRLPKGHVSWLQRLRGQIPQVEYVLVDMRARDLTIKGQEILTADKVAIRVSILAQYSVVDAKAAIHAVASYEDRLYSDIQLAARRSLASMNLEEILTNRHQLSEEILRDVKESAASYGVSIVRADVKDLVFPGNLQDIMNKVLAAERTAEAQLIDARTKAEVQRIDAQTKADNQRLASEAEAEATRQQRLALLESKREQLAEELAALEARAGKAKLYADHPNLMRLEELSTLRDLARNANARIRLDFGANPMPSAADPS
jgi:regulator of protease activity HflC (stomatin/prohibitin superfamily)